MSSGIGSGPLIRPEIPMIAITGGPCGGKSSFLAKVREMLEKHGIRVIVVSETATELITAGITPDLLGGAWFQRKLLIYLLQREDFYRATAKLVQSEECPVVILCDRGALDGAAYVDDEGFAEVTKALETTYTDLCHRYLMVIHLVTAADGAEGFYTLGNNAARSESPEEAMAIDRRTQMVWMQHPHHFIIDNRTGFSLKIERAVQALGRMLKMPQPLEIELKYRLLNFDFAMVPEDAASTDIVQHYLIYEGKGERRVRRSTTEDGVTYTYTEKLPTGERGTRVENERVITEDEYEQFLALELDPKCAPIEKTRYTFPYGGQRLELDYYTCGRPAKQGLIIVEVEVRDINEPVVLPPGWQVEDVTDDPSYKNRALAAL